MSEITAVIDRLRRDIEQIENGQATTLREKGHQIGRIVTAFQGILEEFTTSVTHIQKELENACETAKVKQIQLFTSLLDLQASIEYEFAAPVGSGAGHSRHGGTAAAGTHAAVFDGDRLRPTSPTASGGRSSPRLQPGDAEQRFLGRGGPTALAMRAWPTVAPAMRFSGSGFLVQLPCPVPILVGRHGREAVELLQHDRAWSIAGHAGEAGLEPLAGERPFRFAVGGERFGIPRREGALPR